MPRANADGQAGVGTACRSESTPQFLADGARPLLWGVPSDPATSRPRPSPVLRFLRYDLPLGLWMAVILRASSETYAAPHTSRILEPLLHWLVPTLSTSAVDQVVFLVRKAAHLTEYAILGGLFFRRFARAGRRGLGDAVRLAFVCSFAWAAVDEARQALTMTREAAFHDVLLDGVGAALGLAASAALTFSALRRDRVTRRPPPAD
jgi:VanZ family protein